MSLFLENPWPAIVGGVIAEVVLVVMLFTTGRVRLVAWMAAVAAVSGALILVERFVVTDREQIENDMHAMAQALIDGNRDRLFEHIAPSANEVRARAGFALRFTFREVRINNDLRIDVRDDVDPPQAQAKCTVTVTGSGGGMQATAPVQIDAVFKKVDRRWLVYSAKDSVGLK